VVEVQVESGAERPITSEKWPPWEGGQVAWLSDGSGLIVIAPDQSSFSVQLWHISYPGGEVRKITNDLINYNRLSLTEKEMAFSWLERGLAAGAITVFYKDEPVWDPIRSDSRFADLLRRMAIPS
jgi:hypothetical protein